MSNVFLYRCKNNAVRHLYRYFVISAMLIFLSFGLVLSPVLANEQPQTKAWEAHPPLHAKPDQTKSPTGLFPSKIRHAYGLDNLTCSFTSATWPNSSLCGNGQTIAIVDAYDDPNIASDLNTFDTQFGLPPCTVANGCFVESKPSGNPVYNRGWAQEISLDVQWAHAIAPGAKIMLVEAKTNSNHNLLVAVDNASSTLGVHQVSMSWGGSEMANEATLDSHFSKTGVSFFASSGDSGNGVEWPAVSPNVIGVGGTTLNLNATNGNVLSETAWSGSGGGVSIYESKPSYQVNQTTSFRTVPDVSYNADPNTGVPVYISKGCTHSKCWWQFGGTSAGSPQWAALLAIVNSARDTPLSSVSSGTSHSIYSAATPNTNYHQNFRDIISGSNGLCGFNCNTQIGYDFVTGLGSPLSNNVIPFLQTH